MKPFPEPVRVYHNREHREGPPWPEGPWTDEPDKVQWVDPATGLDCLLHRNHLGAWCGYVGVPRSHPMYGKHYGDVEVDVHGDLTYAATCQDTSDESIGICHVPEPGRPHDVWWFGFDCGHGGDFMPGSAALYIELEKTHKRMMEENPALVSMPRRRLFADPEEDHYWTIDEARAEVEGMALQLAEIARERRYD